jgi:hypothetical protein
LYFLHGGRPRFVMSEPMAQRGYAAIAALLAGEQYNDLSSRSSVPVPLVVGAPSAATVALPSSSGLALRREASLTRFAAAPRPAFLAPAVLAASIVVLAIGLLAVGVVTPHFASRATAPAPVPVSPPVVSLGASPTPPAMVAATTPVLTPSQPIEAPKQASALRYARTRRPAVRAQSAPAPATPGVARISPVYPPARFIVVSGALPLGVAVRRASALVAVGLSEIPQVVSLGTTSATLYYGGFNTQSEAQSLATRVRSLGYTATVINE